MVESSVTQNQEEKPQPEKEGEEKKEAKEYDHHGHPGSGDQGAGARQTVSRHPVDRGWAWVILLCVFVIQFVCAGFQRAFGVLFVAIQLHYQASASMIAVFGALEAAFFSVTALLCMSAVLELVSVRRTILMGAMVGVVGFLACFKATEAVHFVFTFSPFIGVAIGMTVGPGFVLLNAYFDKKLPVATAVANTGGSIGSVVMPMVMRMLIDEYHLSGACLLLAGIFGQLLVFGALLTPPGDYKPRQPVRSEKDLSREEKTRRMIQRQRLLAKRMRQERSGHRTFSDSAVNEVKENRQPDSEAGGKPPTESLRSITDRNFRPLQTFPTRQGSTDALIMAVGTGGSRAMSLSSLDVYAKLFIKDGFTSERGKTVECIQNSSDSIQQLAEDSSSGSKVVCKKLSGMFDPALLRSVVFWMLALYHYLAVLVSGLPSAYLPALALEKGLTTTQGALLLTVSGGLDILSRLVPGLLAQSKLVRPQVSVMVSLLVLGVLFQLTSVVEGVVSLMVMSVVYGLFSGVFFSMLPLIILDFSDLHRFRQIFGFTQLSLGISGATGFPVVGYLRDRTGSYVLSFHFMGACGLLSSVVLCVMPLLQRLEAARRRSQPGQQTPMEQRVKPADDRHG